MTINDLGDGGGGNFRNEFIFSREPLPYKIFFSAKPLKIYFFPESTFQNLFFSHRRASEIIFFLISSGSTPKSLMVVPLI